MLYTRTPDVMNYNTPTPQHLMLYNTTSSVCSVSSQLLVVRRVLSAPCCFFVNKATTFFCVPREHIQEIDNDICSYAPCFHNHIFIMGINNLEQSSRTVNNHVLEHFCLSLLHFLGAAPRSCRGVSPLFSILLSTLLCRSPLFSILLFISPIFHLTLLLHLRPLFSILFSQCAMLLCSLTIHYYQAHCYAIFLCSLDVEI